MNNEFAKAFGERLKYYRKKKGLSRQDMVDRLDISRASTFGLYEQGRVQPTLEGLKKIAEILEVSVDTLLNGTVEDSVEVCINQWREVGFEVEKRDERYIIKDETISAAFSELDNIDEKLAVTFFSMSETDFMKFTEDMKEEGRLAFNNTVKKIYFQIFKNKVEEIKLTAKAISSAD